MNVNVNFYGHSVDVSPNDIAENLGVDATRKEVEAAVRDDVDEALREEFPQYRADVEDVVDAVMERLAELKKEEEL